jgi:hypothetical protein
MISSPMFSNVSSLKGTRVHTGYGNKRRFGWAIKVVHDEFFHPLRRSAYV